MSLLQLAWKNISGNSLRSWVVAICALVVAAFALFATLLLRGAGTSLELAADRLGADIVVVPEGAETKIEGALMMGVPAQFWMPAENVEKLAAIPGVELVSPQIYLATLTGASCCSVQNMFMVAYDPQTDFTIRPWLKEQLGDGLKLGEVIGGSYISATEGKNNIRLYGYLVTLKSNIEPTGAGLGPESVFHAGYRARHLPHLADPGGEASHHPFETSLGGSGQSEARKRPASGRDSDIPQRPGRHAHRERQSLPVIAQAVDQPAQHCCAHDGLDLTAFRGADRPGLSDGSQ